MSQKRWVCSEDEGFSCDTLVEIYEALRPGGYHGIFWVACFETNPEGRLFSDYCVWPFLYILIFKMIEGSLEVQLPTIWTDGKAEVGRVREEKDRRKMKKEDQRREKIRMREKVEKCQHTSKHSVFQIPMFCGSGGSKSRLAKAADAEPSGEMRDDKLHARSRSGSQKVKTPHVRAILAVWMSNALAPEHFWKLRCRKVHTVVARSTVGGQNGKNTTFGPLLEAAMSKTCTPLWHEAHFEVNILKAHHFWATF